MDLLIDGRGGSGRSSPPTLWHDARGSGHPGYLSIRCVSFPFLGCPESFERGVQSLTTTCADHDVDNRGELLQFTAVVSSDDAPLSRWHHI